MSIDHDSKNQLNQQGEIIFKLLKKSVLATNRIVRF